MRVIVRHEFEQAEFASGFDTESCESYNGYDRPFARCSQCNGLAPSHGIIPAYCGHYPWCPRSASGIVAEQWGSNVVPPREWAEANGPYSEWKTHLREGAD